MNSSYMNSFYYFPCANWLILYMNIKSSSLPSHTRVIWKPLVPWAGRTSSSPPIPMGQACCYAPLLSSLFASDERMAMEPSFCFLFWYMEPWFSSTPPPPSDFPDALTFASWIHIELAYFLTYHLNFHPLLYMVHLYLTHHRISSHGKISPFTISKRCFLFHLYQPLPFLGHSSLPPWK